jgi:hypothetical protein
VIAGRERRMETNQNETEDGKAVIFIYIDPIHSSSLAQVR